MRLAVLISRLNHLRHVDSVVAVAQTRGHDVTVLVLQDAVKDSRPVVEYRPARWRSLPVATVVAPDALWPTLEAMRVEAVVSLIDPPEPWAPPRVLRARLPQTVSNALTLHPNSWDRVYTWSPAWTAFFATARGRTHDHEHRRFALIARPVGWPELDGLGGIDPDAVRWDFHLPRDDRPIVLYLPLPYGAVPWEFRVHGLYGWGGEPRALARLRALADRHDAWIVVKSRAKTPVRRVVRDAADLVVEDDEPGEATMLRLLSVSQLVVHHVSLSVVEAVASRVLACGILPPGWNAYRSRRAVPDLDPAHVPSLYAWPGVAGMSSPRQWRAEVPALALERAPDEAARRAYLDRYLGGAPGLAGARIVEDLERSV